MSKDDLSKHETPARDLPTESRAPIDTHEIDVQFSVGELVRHKLFGYRGVIFDVDACFQGTDDWYEKVAGSRPPRNRPWYHVLVHDAEHTTYVAERNLESDLEGEAVDHPLMQQLFAGRQDGFYMPAQGVN